MKYTIDELKKAIKNSYSIRQLLKQLGLAEAGGNYKTIKNKIEEFNLDVSHFHGQGWRRGSKYPVVPAKPTKDLLVKNSHYQSFKLKNRLFKEKLKEYKCENCKLTSWENEIIPLELHHINGVSTDNRLINLSVLCPNCHALTKNYRAKNIKKV
jgi:hypothetical protein